MPSVTVVVAARPGQAMIKAVPAARALEYPPDRLEIVVARGKQPSAQRNAAIKEARGEWIYFLDDDSVPHPDNLSKVAAYFSRPEVKMVGGPNLCPADAPELEHIFALVLSSWVFASSRSRYSQVGVPRETSEKELILCNLLARRDALLELGGFNEALYPNEENALMDELQKRGGKLVYDPELIVFRRPRSSLAAFARMLMTYGRGRAEQFRLHPTTGSALNFAPPLFVVYLLSLIAEPWIGPVWFAPLTAYLGLVLIQAVALARKRPEPRNSSSTPVQQASKPGPALHLWRAAAATPLVFLTPILYGLGFWRGLFTVLRKPGERQPVQVILEHVA
ncbi:MAG TPA: glycosyltransferase [Verrucomicrobiae bacterium]|nr:glycosyltransferase [Verrucomicrobiae bacterium]